MKARQAKIAKMCEIARKVRIDMNAQLDWDFYKLLVR